MGEIYLITNTINHKEYVGQTIGCSVKRWKQHVYEANNNPRKSVYLNNAICYYGVDAFQVTIIEKNVTLEALDEIETYYIHAFNTLAPIGYNIQVGGQSVGRRHCVESRQRMSESKKGAKNYNFGKPRSDSTKQKISLAKSGEKHHFFGKSFTHEHRLNLSKAHKKDELPMYICYIHERPKQYQSAGYVVIHPNFPKKYFTSKKYSMEEKFVLAKNYLSCIDMSPVKRLDGDG